MSDTFVEYFYAWFKYFASNISSDTVIIVTIIFYAIITFALLVYKFASYDCDVLYGAKNTISYLRASAKSRSGSLNYYMRSFPTCISRAWERYYSEKKGKPSDYLTTDLAYSFGTLEKGFVFGMQVSVVLATLTNLVFAILSDRMPLSQSLFMPISACVIGTVCIFIVNLAFTITKRCALIKYSEMVKALNFYAANNYNEKVEEKAGVVSAIDNISSELAENLSQILSEDPQTNQ